LTKHYGGVHALEDANFVLHEGEHVAVVGDNGAGKSTFVRQVTAVEQRSAGEVFFEGQPVNFSGPLETREAGIETVFQTLALADDLDVPSNMFMGRELFKFRLGPFSWLDRKAMRDRTLEALRTTAVKIPNIDNPIRNMSGGQRQCVHRTHGGLCVKAGDHGRTDGCPWRVGNRTGGKHHPGPERTGNPDDPDLPQLTASL
jgi:fructose transport system ATP-binding protein